MKAVWDIRHRQCQRRLMFEYKTYPQLYVMQIISKIANLYNSHDIVSYSDISLARVINIKT